MSASVSSFAVSSPSPAPAPLKAERIQLQMQRLPGWRLSHDGRQAWRTFRFLSRNESFAFLRRALRTAESVPVAIGMRGPTVSYRGGTVTVSIWAFDGSFIEADVAMGRSVGRLI